MARPDRPSTLQRRLRERLTHNEAYLAQSVGSRIFTSSLTFGVAQGEQWIAGEESAIRCENEWIRVLLNEPVPPAPEPKWREMNV